MIVHKLFSRYGNYYVQLYHKLYHVEFGLRIYVVDDDS